MKTENLIRSTVLAKRKVLVMTGTATVPTRARYDFNRLDIGSVKAEIYQFLVNLLKHRQVTFDWGTETFAACNEPICVDYRANTITPAEPNSWSACGAEKLHHALQNIFKGKWGPSSLDATVRMLNSGIEVYLCGNRKFLPKNPKLFMDKLKRKLKRNDRARVIRVKARSLKRKL